MPHEWSRGRNVIVTIAPGAIQLNRVSGCVSVTDGQIELECENGMVAQLRRGCLLCLAELPLRAVRSTGAAPPQLVSISRRAH